MKKYLKPLAKIEIISTEDIMQNSGDPQMIANVGTVVSFWTGVEVDE